MSPARTGDGTLALLCDRVSHVKKSKEYATPTFDVRLMEHGGGQKYGVVFLSRRRATNQHQRLLARMPRYIDRYSL